MGDKALTGFIAILTAIIGVAIIAVLVSKNANTTAVIGAGSQGFSQSLATALSPITGGSGNFNFGGGASYLGN